VAPRAQDIAEAFLRRAVGGGGVEQGDAVLKREVEQRGNFFVRRQGEALAAGIFHAPVAPELDGAEAEDADLPPCRGEGAAGQRPGIWRGQVILRHAAPSHGYLPMAAGGSSAGGASVAAGTMSLSFSHSKTLSASAGAKVSF